MVKAHYNLSLNPEVWRKAQTMFPNKISSMVNEYLENLINSKSNNLEKIDIEIERLQLLQETKKLSEIKASIQKRTILIENYESELEEKKIQQLEQEKKRIESINKCQTEFCSNNGDRTYKGKPICKSCFMNM